MARRGGDEDGKDTKKRAAANRERDEEQERKLEEGKEKKKEVESESSRAQNQMGNQGVQALLAAQGHGAKGQGTGKGGVESEQVKRKKAHEKEGQDFGGEPDPSAPDITEWDLLRDWNPVTTAPSDRTAFHEPMPAVEVPPEDEAYLAELPALAPEATEGDLQPTVAAVVGPFVGWSRGVSRWAHLGPTWPMVALVGRRSAPLLQDASGRVLLLRARTAALSTLALGAYRFPGGARPWLRALLEIESREGHVRDAARRLGKPDELPTAGRLFDALVPPPQDEAPAEPPPAVKLPPGPLAAWVAVIEQIVALEDAAGLVPLLSAPGEPEDDPDDFLGLDSLIAEFTGGPKDRSEAVYRTAIQAAEKLAGATTQARVRFAGTAAVLHATSLQLGGPSRAALRTLADVADQETQRVLQLLLEVARAAQRRTVPPPGLQNGLRRAAAALTRGRRAIAVYAAQVWDTAIAAPPELAYDPTIARVWVDADPDVIDGLPRDAVATAFADLATAIEPAPLVVRFEALRKTTTDGRVAAALGVALGALRLRDGDLTGLDRLAASQADIGRRAGNGLVIADAAMLTLELALRTGRADRVPAIRAAAGAELAQRGAHAGLTLLARWTPPLVEDSA